MPSMPSHIYAAVADELVLLVHREYQLHGRSFLPMPRMRITELLRDMFGKSSTSIKCRIADELTYALESQRVRVFPSLRHKHRRQGVAVSLW